MFLLDCDPEPVIGVQTEEPLKSQLYTLKTHSTEASGNPRQLGRPQKLFLLEALHTLDCDLTQRRAYMFR